MQKLEKELSVPLSSIIHLSFKTRIFPQICKIANAILIYKKWDQIGGPNRLQKLQANLTAIKHWKYISKVYPPETLQITEQKSRLYTKQFDFGDNQSTNHTLISMTKIKKSFRRQCLFLWGIAEFSEGLWHSQQ